MFSNKFSLSLAAVLFLALSSQISFAKNYKIGTVFNDVAEFNFPAARLKVPLPPGDWKLLSIHSYRTIPSNVELLNHYFIRHTKDIVTGLMRIRVPSESVDSRWAISSNCSRKKESRSWYIHEDSYTGHEDCSRIYPVRGFSRSFKPRQPTHQYIDNNGLTIPNAWVRVSFTRSNDEEFLRAEYAFPQENYGFPREQKFSNTKSPWNINNIDSYPKKKAFMKKAIVWAKSWKGLVDKGFKNKLTKGEVRVHMRIDGSFNKIPQMIKRPNATTLDVEGKLKKLKRLLDKKLISPEEYRDQRIKVLGTL
jgi:hypothetical protein